MCFLSLYFKVAIYGPHYRETSKTDFCALAVEGELLSVFLLFQFRIFKVLPSSCF